jgi:GAF domain-containing protein
MVIPIQTGEITLGVMTLDNFNTPSAFSEEDEALVTSLAQQTALTLENARLFQASEQRAAQLQALTDVATTITSSLDPDALIASLLDQLAGVIPFETGILWLRQGDQLSVRAARGFEDSEDRIGLSVDIEDSPMIKEMIETGKPITVANVNEDERFPAPLDHKYLSWLGIPLITKGEVIGVIALEKTEPDFYTHEHIQVTTTFAGQAAVALENARLFTESLRFTEELEQRVAERTEDVAREHQRASTLLRISTELSASLDLDHVINRSLMLLNETSGAEQSCIVLVRPGLNKLYYRAGVG